MNELITYIKGMIKAEKNEQIKLVKYSNIGWHCSCARNHAYYDVLEQIKRINNDET